MTAHRIAGVAGRMADKLICKGRWTIPDLFRRQVWTSEARPAVGHDPDAVLTVSIRFDDQCRNGHHTFAITGTLRRAGIPGERGWLAGGCLHDDIAATFPELAHLIRWHLVSTDGPLHYIASTVYFAGHRDAFGKAQGKPRELDKARAAAIWPEATDAELCAPAAELEAALIARLPALLERFRADVEAAGFRWAPAQEAA